MADLAPENISTLDRLVRSIDMAEGFALFIARCNVPVLRNDLILAARQQLAALGIEVIEVIFEGEPADVRDRLRAALSAADAPIPVELPAPRPALALAERPADYTAGVKRAVFVTGLELGIPFDQPNSRILAELNLGRDLFLRDAPHPLVLWLPDYAVTAVARFAPDFWAWRSGVFEFETGEAERSAALDQFVGDRPWRALANLTPESRLLCRRQLESLLDDYRDLSDNPRVTGERSRILADLGDVCAAAQDYSQAMGYYQRALELQRQGGDHGGEAATLNNLAAMYNALGEKRKALALYELALPLRRQVGNRGGEAVTLNNIGLVYDAMGEKYKALDYYEQALPLRRQVGDRGGEAATLNNIGLVYSALGNNRKALDYYEQALPLSRQVGDRGGEATTLNNIGRIYDALGEKRKALDYYEQALPLQRQVGDRGGEAMTLNNLGGVYDALGEKRKALDYYEQALPLRRQVGDRGGEATTLNNIGAMYTALGDKRKALDFYEQALPLRCQVGDRWGESVTRFNIGMVYEALGDLAKAEEQLALVVALDEAVGHPDLTSDRAALERVRAKHRTGSGQRAGT